MFKKYGITFGGLQQKIINLVLVFLLVLTGVFGGMSVFQSNALSDVVGGARVEQERSITQVSEATMHATVEGTMQQSTTMRAQIADDDFLEVVENIKLMRSVAEDLFEKRDIIVPAAFSLPDPADDGKVTAQVLYEQGVDYANSEYLGIASHMNNLMIAMYNNSSNVGNTTRAAD